MRRIEVAGQIWLTKAAESKSVAVDFAMPRPAMSKNKCVESEFLPIFTSISVM